MNARRWVIVIALLGILHNTLRALAAIEGAHWGFFNLQWKVPSAW
jgi:hypothetical protein